MRKLQQLLCLLFVFLTCSQVACADVGLFVRSGTSSINNPVANQTWVFDAVDQFLKYWDGSAWQYATLPKSNMFGIGPPGTSNDTTQNYRQGSLWFDTSGQQFYVCTSNTTGAATWNILTNRIALTDIQTKLTIADLASDWLQSGLVGSVPSSSLTMTTPTGVAIVSGNRITPSASTYTYPVSSDIYDYLQTNGSFNHPAVANGGTPPTGQTGLLIQKVVTSGSAITSVAQLAPTAPLFTVQNPTLAQHALTLGYADSRYAPINYVINSMVNPMTTLGDMIYESAALVAAQLPGNTSTTKQFLTQTGTGSASAIPAWATIQSADLPANTLVPYGTIVAWWSTDSTIPTGWALCNGQTTTWQTGPHAGSSVTLPNLIGMFIQGTDITGGSSTANANGFGSQGNQSQQGAATHSHTYSGTTSYESGAQSRGSSGALVPTYPHVHTYSGTTSSANTQPPCYAIVYIMKL